MESKKRLVWMLLVFAISGFFISKIDIDNAPMTYVRSDTDIFAQTEKARKVFPNDENMIMTFSIPEGKSDQFLLKLKQFTEEIEGIDGIIKIRSIFNTDYIQTNEDGFSVEKIAPENNFSYKDILERIEKSPLGGDVLVSKDKTKMAILVEPERKLKSIGRIKLYQKIHSIAKQSGLDKLIAEQAGPFAIDVFEFDSMINDLSTVVPLTYLVGPLLLYLQFSSFYIVFLSVLIMYLSVNSCLLIFFLADWPFNLVGGILPSFISALAVAFILHLLNSVKQEFIFKGDVKHAIKEGTKKIIKPAMFSALTTSVGLFSLTTSSIIPIKNFGIAGGVGIIMIFLYVCFVMPWLLQTTSNIHWQGKTILGKIFNRFVFKMFNFSLRWHKLVVLLTIIVSIAIVPLIMKIKTETNFLKFFKADHKIVEGTYAIGREFVGTNPLNIIFSSDQHENLETRNFFVFLKKLKEMCEQMPEIDKALSAYDFIWEMHKAFVGNDAGDQELPESDDAFAQYLLIFDGDDLKTFYDSSERMSKMNIFLNTHGAKESGIVIERLRLFLEKNIPEDVDFNFGGVANLVHYQEKQLVDGQVKSVVYGGVLIFLMMILLWRNLFASLVCMIPNISPVLFMFALMGTFGIWLDMGTAMVASISIGIAVDDTIHIFHNYKYFIRKGHGLIYALGRTFKRSGCAITGTTVILAFQFFVLATSDFVPTINFGILTGVGVSIALIFDLLFLPALLYWLGNSKIFMTLITGRKG